MVTRVTNDVTIVFEGHLASLGKSRNRYCIIISPELSQHFGKYTNYEITCRPVGSIGKIEVVRDA